ncbi:hypothetical protein PAPYR_4358 [Paratrimastix pyriformis]|uniref:SH2 domain-containing protein n=1 Tax=Paratrimastix pyriformis TaxID=342808 RepID=A0ABQ8ULC5_9EUKA|nr:hypothetical protein PAPYR_4358 [Paratrimastix pyriformis]
MMQGMPGMQKVRVLAVFANAKQDPDLRLMNEHRAIQQCVSSNPNLELEVLPSSTIHQLQQRLMKDPRFRIIHFSGHATAQGLVFENEKSSAPHVVPPRAMAELLSGCCPPLECVVLVACSTLAQGELLSTTSRLPYVIAMSERISNRDASLFVNGFYSALASGSDVVAAFHEGRRAISLDRENGGSIVVLLPNASIHPYPPGDQFGGGQMMTQRPEAMMGPQGALMSQQGMRGGEGAMGSQQAAMMCMRADPMQMQAMRGDMRADPMQMQAMRGDMQMQGMRGDMRTEMGPQGMRAEAIMTQQGMVGMRGAEGPMGPMSGWGPDPAMGMRMMGSMQPGGMMAGGYPGGPMGSMMGGDQAAMAAMMMGGGPGGMEGALSSSHFTASRMAATTGGMASSPMGTVMGPRGIPMSLHHSISSPMSFESRQPVLSDHQQQTLARVHKLLDPFDDACKFWSLLVIQETIQWTQFITLLSQSVSHLRKHPTSERYLRVFLAEKDGLVSLERFADFCRYFGTPLSTAIHRARRVLKERWFHGMVSRARVPELLAGKPAGTFMVRFSQSKPGTYAADIVGPDMKPQHPAHPSLGVVRLWWPWVAGPQFHDITWDQDGVVHHLKEGYKRYKNMCDLVLSTPSMSAPLDHPPASRFAEFHNQPLSPCSTDDEFDDAMVRPAGCAP